MLNQLIDLTLYHLPTLAVVMLAVYLVAEDKFGILDMLGIAVLVVLGLELLKTLTFEGLSLRGGGGGLQVVSTKCAWTGAMKVGSNPKIEAKFNGSSLFRLQVRG